MYNNNYTIIFLFLQYYLQNFFAFLAKILKFYKVGNFYIDKTGA